MSPFQVKMFHGMHFKMLDWLTYRVIPVTYMSHLSMLALEMILLLMEVIS